MQIAEERVDYLGRLNAASTCSSPDTENHDDAAFTAGPLLVIAGAGTGKTMDTGNIVLHTW